MPATPTPGLQQHRMAAWQSRPLDPVYPVIFIDCVNVKIRDGNVANRPI
jgi:putative transposase